MRCRGLIEDAVSPASFERHLRGWVGKRLLVLKTKVSTAKRLYAARCNSPASSAKLWGRPAWPRRQASALEAKKRFTTARSFLLELKPYSVRIETRSFKVFKFDLVFNCLKTSFHCQMRGPKTYIIIWQKHMCDHSLLIALNCVVCKIWRRQCRRSHFESNSSARKLFCATTFNAPFQLLQNRLQQKKRVKVRRTRAPH